MRVLSVKQPWASLDSRLEGMVIEGPVVRCPRCAEETLGAVGLCRKCQVEYAVCAPLKPHWIDRVWRWCWEHLR